MRSLTYRAQHVVSEQEDQEKEKTHIIQALTANDYPAWSLKTSKRTNQPNSKTKSNNKHTEQKQNRITVPLTYCRGISEKLNRVFHRHGINVYHKPTNTMRNLLVRPKDPTPVDKRCGVIIYHIECPECEQIYIGETSPPMGTRFKEHLKTEGNSNRGTC